MNPKKEDFKNTILFFCPNGLPEIYVQMVEADQKNKKYEFGEIKASEDVKDLVVKHDGASLLFSIQTRDDLVQLLTICKLNVEKIRQGVLKIGGMNLTGAHRLDDILKKSGVSDVFLETISPRTLDYKINFWAKGIRTNIKKIKPAAKGKFSFNNNTSGAQESETGESTGGKISVLPALKFSSDCWILDNAPEEPRKVMGHWVLDLIGPSPYAGRWIEIKKTDSSEDLLWEWTPLHVESFPFIEHDGRWIAKGRQPQFVWKSNSWKFMGSAPALIFELQKGDPVYRFYTENDNLYVAEDSVYALQKRSLIEESFDPKIVQKKEQDRSKENLESDEEEVNAKKALGEQEEENAELEKFAKNEAVKLDDLLGYGATENLGQDHLKGKAELKKEKEVQDPFGLDELLQRHGVTPASQTHKPEIDEDAQHPDLSDLDGKLFDDISGEDLSDSKNEKEEKRKQKKDGTLIRPPRLEDIMKGSLSSSVPSDDKKQKKASGLGEVLKEKPQLRPLSSKEDHEKPDFSSTDLELEEDIDNGKKESGQGKGKAKNHAPRAPSLSKLLDDFPEESDAHLDLEVEPVEEDLDEEKTNSGNVTALHRQGAKFPTPDKHAGLKGLKQQNKEQPKRRHSGINGENPSETGGYGAVDKIDNGPLAGKGGDNSIENPISGTGAVDKLEDNPLTGEGAEADRLNNLLHGKTSWKDELDGHLKLTKLQIELLMSIKNNPEEVSVKLGDIVDNIFVLFVPIGFYKFGQIVNIKIMCSYGSFDLKFSVIGKVVDLYENDDESECCNVELTEFSDEKIKQLRRFFGDRQKNITRFFIQAKGIS